MSEMQTSRGAVDRRRSERTAASIPIYIESLEPTVFFSGRCNSVDVSVHGCRFFISRPFKRGTRLRLDVHGAHHAASVSARVIHSLPASSDMNIRLWKVGVEFANPGNFWNQEWSPLDWLDPSPRLP